MSKPIIRVEGLSKQYRIGARERAYKTIRESLMDAVIAPFRRINGHPQCAIRNPHSEYIWALKDVSFDVQPGEVLGIIGRNGAGKSTLLKILSRITEPTEGRAKVGGRVGSLLEVGTGFHHELTGRENVYLNGAILGMRKAEIDRKFDEIVAFSEVEKFIDTPVKYYSSGMYVRLAFAVAAHLEPEILIVDEVLAVGDAAFQKKCLSKMQHVGREGRTVLFVSHNMGVLRDLCTRSIWLNSGMLEYDGLSKEAIGRYLSMNDLDTVVIDLTKHPNRLQDMLPVLTKATLRLTDGTPTNNFSQRDSILIEMEYRAPSDVRVAGAGFALHTIDGMRVGGFNTYMSSQPPHTLPSAALVRFILAPAQLTPGSYSLALTLGSHPSVLLDKVERALTFTIHPADIYGTGYLLTSDDGVAALKVEVETCASYAHLQDSPFLTR